jgi:hypothetical protein
MAGFGRIGGVCVNPDPGELLRRAAEVDLLLEVVGDPLVREPDRDRGAELGNELDVLDQEGVFHRRDPEPADFRRSEVAEVLELGPGVGGEPEGGTWPAEMATAES